MRFFIYRKNIFLFLFISFICANTPTVDAGSDISETVTSCIDKNIIILVNGSGSSNPGLGVCDTGVCSDTATGEMSPKYCTTTLGPTNEECSESLDCGVVKYCEGGENDGNVCTNELAGYCGTGSCEFLIQCLSEYSYKEYCEGDWDEDGVPDGEWAPSYQYIDEASCDDLHGISNHKWYDYSLEFNWYSNSENLNIINNKDVTTDIVFDPISSSEAQVDTVYLTVSNQFESKTDFLLITLDPKLPCAVAGEDLYLCRACADSNSSLFNPTYVADVLGNLQLDASSSYGAGNLSYSWTVPDGFTLSSLNAANPVVSSSDYASIRKSINIFTLEVTDNNSNLASKLDTVVVYMNPSRPTSPKVEVYPQNDKITLNWKRNSSVFSIDSLSGYSDFEGYRVYKSIDGGETWGSADDRIYYNGEHVGWRHEEQSDLSEYGDSNFCNRGVNVNIIGDGLTYKTWDDCIAVESNSETCCNGGSVRGHSISNLDPYAPWINLGDDSGLNFSYVDTSVYNGKEYTYAVVAYDIGLQAYVNETSATGNGICSPCVSSDPEVTNTEEQCCVVNGGAWDSVDNVCDGSCSGADHLWAATYEYIITWPSTNPDEFTYDGVNGFHSLESYLVDSINVVTVIPAFYAENVEQISNFIDEDKDFGVPAEDKFMNRDSTTVGNGGIYFQIINPYDITDKKYEFQVQADYAVGGEKIFEGYKTERPKLYAWEVNNDDIPLTYDYSITSEDQLTHDEKCELLNLPGAYNDGSCSRWTRVCEGGNFDGEECTYDEDYCTNGLCVDSEVNYLTDYYSCVCDDLLAELSGASGSLNGLADNYNDWLLGGDTIFYPIYEIEDFSIMYLEQDGYEENYSDFLDGLKFIFNNNVENVENLENGQVKVNTLQSYNSLGQETSLSDYIDVKLEYGDGGNVFDYKPSYSYRIEFSDTPKYESALTVPQSSCNGRPWSFLPFKVINTTTNKVVGIYHVDKGGFYDEAGEYDAFGTCVEDGNPCGLDQYCNVNECIDLKGYGDCAWGKNERTSFKQDTVHVGLTTKETPEYTFDLKIDYRVFALYSQGISPDQIDPWFLGVSYSTNDVVKYNDMFWKATSTPDPLVEPTKWIDDGNDNNLNPWAPIYPWDDGDYIIIEPTRWYVDGDSWIADLYQLGRDSDVTKEALEKISVVPNPYIVYSDYDETPDERKLWFNHLPNRCRITIYTISGERVASILHDDDALSGKESWDLRSQGGDLVAPGLYIYTVESDAILNNGKDDYIKHISKFAIIR